MIDNNRFQELLEEYKSELKGNRWDDEKFKWQTIKGFQDHWDIEAVDFCTMLKNSLDKTFNLLASTHYFPGKMIKEFAEKNLKQCDKCLRIYLMRIKIYVIESFLLKFNQNN